MDWKVTGSLVAHTFSITLLFLSIFAAIPWLATFDYLSNFCRTYRQAYSGTNYNANCTYPYRCSACVIVGYVFLFFAFFGSVARQALWLLPQIQHRLKTPKNALFADLAIAGLIFLIALLCSIGGSRPEIDQVPGYPMALDVVFGFAFALWFAFFGLIAAIVLDFLIIREHDNSPQQPSNLAHQQVPQPGYYQKPAETVGVQHHSGHGNEPRNPQISVISGGHLHQQQHSAYYQEPPASYPPPPQQQAQNPQHHQSSPEHHQEHVTVHQESKVQQHRPEPTPRNQHVVTHEPEIHSKPRKSRDSNHSSSESSSEHSPEPVRSKKKEKSKKIKEEKERHYDQVDEDSEPIDTSKYGGHHSPGPSKSSKHEKSKKKDKNPGRHYDQVGDFSSKHSSSCSSDESNEEHAEKRAAKLPKKVPPPDSDHSSH